MKWNPSSKEYLDRSPEGTPTLAASSHKRRQAGRLGSGPALGPADYFGFMDNS